MGDRIEVEQVESEQHGVRWRFVVRGTPEAIHGIPRWRTADEARAEGEIYLDELRRKTMADPAHARIAAVVLAAKAYHDAISLSESDAAWTALDDALAALTPEDLARFGIVEGK